MVKNMKFSHILVFAWLSLIFISGTIGRIEGHFFPVIDNFSVNVKQFGQYESSITGSFRKIRDCEFEDIKWYIKLNDYKSRTQMVMKDEQTVRHAGEQFFGPWLISSKSNIVKNYSYVEVFHNCGAFWQTVTGFYPNI